MSDTIYRAMGWTPNPHVCDDPTCIEARSWRDPRRSTKKRDYFDFLPDPLTDWSAFGEILEWAEKWADEKGYDWETDRFDGQWRVCFVWRGTRGYGQSPDFRTAVLAALESAIGGEQ